MGVPNEDINNYEETLISDWRGKSPRLSIVPPSAIEIPSMSGSDDLDFKLVSARALVFAVGTHQTISTCDCDVCVIQTAFEQSHTLDGSTLKNYLASTV